MAPTVLTNAADQLLDYSERFMRAEIQGIPDGVYEAEDCMEDDGVSDRPYFGRLRLTVANDEVIADWRASDPQARGPINATFVVTAAATYSGLLHVISNDIPLNSGCYRPIRLITTPGTLTNVRHPGASVGGNTETHPRLQNIVLRALAQAIPDRVAAAEGATACNFLFGGVHPRSGEYYTNYHIEGSGWGGTATHDGGSVLCPENGNCRNAPVEVFESKYPFLTRSYHLRPDSGGPGRFRGGLASSRHLVVTAPEITVSALMDRTKTRAWGLFGGGEGMSAHILVKRRGELPVPAVLGGIRYDLRFKVHARHASRGRRGHPRVRGRRRVWPARRAAARARAGGRARGLRLPAGGPGRVRG